MAEGIAFVRRNQPRNVSDTDPLPVGGGFNIPQYDEIACTYSGTNLTVAVYKRSGATVATITMTYNGDGNMLTAVRT